MKTSSYQFTVITALSLLLPAALQANEYSLEYGIEGGYEYNDNVTLRSENEIDLSGGRVIIPATLRSRSERLDASLAGELSFARYDKEEWDSDDQDLQGRATYQLESGELDGYAGYKRDSTRDSEFLDTGVTGLSASRRETASIGGSAFHMFTQRNGIIGGLSYSDVDYESVRYSDYKYASGYAGWIHQWNEITRLRLQAYANRFENDGIISVESDGLGVQAGFDYSVSERLEASLLAGWINVETEYGTSLPVEQVPEDSEADGLLLEGSLTYRRERYELRAGLKSQPTPSGDGYMRDTNQLDLKYLYRVSERSKFDMTFIVGQSEAIDSRINNSREYYRIRLRMDYRFSPSWYVAGIYQYSYQDRDRSIGDADSNAVFLSLIFQPEKNVWSR